jgi:hypothetical protein
MYVTESGAVAIHRDDVSGLCCRGRHRRRGHCRAVACAGPLFVLCDIRAVTRAMVVEPFSMSDTSPSSSATLSTTSLTAPSCATHRGKECAQTYQKA